MENVIRSEVDRRIGAPVTLRRSSKFLHQRSKQTLQKGNNRIVS